MTIIKSGGRISTHNDGMAIALCRVLGCASGEYKSRSPKKPFPLFAFICGMKEVAE
jgi:hypothetical protein